MSSDHKVLRNVPLVDIERMHAPISHAISEAVAGVINRRDFVGGKAVSEFERAFADYCGAANCVGVGNGTDAIELALRAYDIGPGTEVITVANSFIATAEAISATGADCIFVDCEADTYLIDINAIEKAISPRTRAIVPVHIYGRLANMEAIMEIAERHNLIVIEDAAQAHGAQRNGRRAGHFGHVGGFSFYPGKNLGAIGDAGAVVTDDPEIAERVRLLANHGRASRNDHVVIGRNSRLDTIQAAVLLVKLAQLDMWNKCRIDVAARYSEQLRNLKVILPKCPTDGSHVFHLYVIRVSDRDQVLEALKARGIGAGIHYQVAIPNMTAYAHLGHDPADFPNATRFSNEVLSLPMHPHVDDADMEYIRTALAEILIANQALN